MESKSFLIVDEQPITLKQAIGSLQFSGQLGNFVREILRGFVLERELQQGDNLDIEPTVIEQAVIDFRLQNQLSDSAKFQEWLVSNGMDFTTFHHQVGLGLQQEKLKEQVCESRLTEFFIERKLFLDRVVLSRIVVAEQELAEELRSQIQEGASFEQLAREYSITEDRIVNGMMGPISRGTLPDELRAVIDRAHPGELIDIQKVEGGFALFRVEQFLPASLEDKQLREALKNELFEQWIAEKIQKLNVKLQVE